MSEKSFNQPLEDEISLKDIIDFLLESWKIIVTSAIIGGVLSAGYAFTLPNQYQARSNIQGAKVGGAEVESPSVLVEKLKMPAYFTEEAFLACNITDTLNAGEVIVKNIKPILIKNTPIISFIYTSDNSEVAKRCSEAILEDIRINQNLLAKNIFELKKSQLKNLKQKLNAAERVVKILPNKSSSFDFPDSNFSASALLLATTLSKENEIIDLKAQINDIEISLSEPYTREAFFTTPIYVPTYKVGPNRTLILMVGLMAGLFLGLLFMLGKRGWHAHKV